ncbi:hypothetical protein GUJ93_ZPchr0007g5444 [Zizania palustris]|uniref:Uncharacterized protein n=1 Tax=Zizania palustris TaxID=103762 RepID=A0A8J5VZF7_ZIZPA|nr:hypothetical protein GUJ93_ZPchr0007g5444 [Zizania palustris]
MTPVMDTNKGPVVGSPNPTALDDASPGRPRRWANFGGAAGSAARKISRRREVLQSGRHPGPALSLPLHCTPAQHPDPPCNSRWRKTRGKRKPTSFAVASGAGGRGPVHYRTHLLLLLPVVVAACAPTVGFLLRGALLLGCLHRMEEKRTRRELGRVTGREEN